MKVGGPEKNETFASNAEAEFQHLLSLARVLLLWVFPANLVCCLDYRRAHSRLSSGDLGGPISMGPKSK